MRRRSVILLCALGLAIGGASAAWAAFAGSTQNGGNNFSAAASFCTGSAYNPAWMTGFEEGLAASLGGAAYDVATGATVDAAVKRSGSYSIRLDSTGAGAYVAKAPAAPVVTLRLAFRFASLPATDITNVVGATTSVGSGLSLGYRASDQKLTLRWGTGTPAVSSTPVAAGSWYVIDLRLDTGANPRTADWQIDGIGESSVSSTEPSGLVSYLGPGSNLASDVFTANYDDILATTSGSDYPIGAGSVLSLLPDGVLTHNTAGNFRNDDGSVISGTSWNRLDDVPMDSLADAVEQPTASGTSYLAFSFANPSSTCIKAVGATVAYATPGGGGGANNGKASIFDGGTERVMYSGDMRNTALAHASITFSPASGSSWTRSAVDALSARVGYSTDQRPTPAWHALQLSYEAQ